MQMDIHEIDIHNQVDFGRCDTSFTVTARLILHTANRKITYTIEDVPHPYTKNYGPRQTDYAEYVDVDDRMIFLAYVGNEIAGEVRMSTAWNKYALLDDIVVDPEFRRQGVGRALIKQAVEWAKTKGFPGLMLETQDNNVAACHFYESCGFELRGFDTHLYKAINPSTDEIALYWYLMF